MRTFLLIFAIVYCVLNANTSLILPPPNPGLSFCAGCWSSVASKDVDITSYATWAIQNLNCTTIVNGSSTIKNITDIKRQVVSGINYNFTLAFTYKDKKTLKVVVKNINFYTIIHIYLIINNYFSKLLFFNYVNRIRLA